MFSANCSEIIHVKCLVNCPMLLPMVAATAATVIAAAISGILILWEELLMCFSFVLQLWT